MLLKFIVASLLLGFLLGGCGGQTTQPATGSEREVVVLLHGLGRSTQAMRYLQYRLENAGYEVFNIGYPSTRLTSDDIVHLLQDRVRICCAHSQKVHFVGHSLGGLMVRALLGEKREVNLGRVVVLGTPNQGTQLVDWLTGNRLFNVLAGPTALHLGTGEDAFPRGLPEPDYDLGVIAGDRSINPIGSWVLSGPDDGIVSVESTRIPGMKDFMLTSAGHVLMRYSDEVADAVIHFLRTGSFSETTGSVESAN
ncbi:MAG TPA: alpha/beta fold hydrolase [Chromatiaceae bacterium]|nr:alpha/beta fold hydrolase [Chromatiaceae bacterium]